MKYEDCKIGMIVYDDLDDFTIGEIVKILKTRVKVKWLASSYRSKILHYQYHNNVLASYDKTHLQFLHSAEKQPNLKSKGKRK